MSQAFVKGQRWMSEAEPEMGLGLVVECEFRRVQVLFPSTGETRMYSSDSAPLKRVQFQTGDTIETHEGSSHVITSIQQTDGIYQYHCGDAVVAETHLADTIKLGSADRRLLDGRVDSGQLFDLRHQGWQHQSLLHDEQDARSGRRDDWNLHDFTPWLERPCRSGGCVRRSGGPRRRRRR